MSIYKFQDSETVVTTTTTGVLAATDPILVWSSSRARTSQTTVGAISGLDLVTAATSGSSATLLTPYGLTTLGSTQSTNGTSNIWVLPAPATTGQYVCLMSVSTSTNNQVTTASTASANFLSTSSWLGTTITFSAPGAYAELQGSTGTGTIAGWLIIGRSTAGVTCT